MNKIIEPSGYIKDVFALSPLTKEQMEMLKKAKEEDIKAEIEHNKLLEKGFGCIQ